jgi:DUF4097 and DUF4098 domain-containing protein YvlB
LNERLRILKLLEEGKIKAEEAERLLQALHEGEGRRRGHHHWGLWNSMESIPDIIGASVAGSFRHASGKEDLHFPRKKKIAFRGISGDIEINGEDTEEIHIEKDGMAKILEEGNTLTIKAISGDLRITTPKDTDIELKGVSGDLDLQDLAGQIDISSVSGDIQGQGLTGSFRGDFVSGDLDLEYKTVERIEIKSKSGDIEIRLDPKVEAALEIESKYGNIECDFELLEKREEDDMLKGVINKPKGKIEIRNDYGDVCITKKK